MAGALMFRFDDVFFENIHGLETLALAEADDELYQEEVQQLAFEFEAARLEELVSRSNYGTSVKLTATVPIRISTQD